MSYITPLKLQEDYKKYECTPAFVKSITQPEADSNNNTDLTLVGRVKNIFLMMVDVLDAIPIINLIPSTGEYLINKCIERQIEKKIEQLNTEEFLKDISPYLRHMNTNINSSSLSEILSKTKVIFLSDKHDSKVYHKIQAILINALWQSKDIILSECMGAMTQYVKPDYRRSEMLWDLQNEGREEDWSFSESRALIEIAKVLKNAFNRGLFSEKSRNSVAKLYSFVNKNLGLELEERNYDFPEDLDTLLWEFAIIWRDAYYAITKKRLLSTLDGQYYYARNVSLVKTVTEQIASGASRIFLIAGASHLDSTYDDFYGEENQDLYRQAVDLVFSTMNEQKIPFVHLRPKKLKLADASVNPDEWRPYVHHNHKPSRIPIEHLSVVSDPRLPSSFSLEKCEEAFEDAYQAFNSTLAEKGAVFSCEVCKTLDLAHRMIFKMQTEIEKSFK